MFRKGKTWVYVKNFCKNSKPVCKSCNSRFIDYLQLLWAMVLVALSFLDLAAADHVVAGLTNEGSFCNGTTITEKQGSGLK